MIHKFFQNDEFLIDQKAKLFEMKNEYKVFNKEGEMLGMVVQKLDTAQVVLRLLLNPTMLPFKVEIKDQEGNVLSSLTRGWTFWTSKITVSDQNGAVIGYVNQKMSFFKPKFTLLDVTGTQVAEIKGDWKAWNFTVTNTNGMEIGTVNKKWAGALKEIFTTADKYYVKVNEALAEDNAKVLILSAAITIDMVLKSQTR